MLTELFEITLFFLASESYHYPVVTWGIDEIEAQLM